MSEEYPVGTQILCNQIMGEVVTNDKLTGDILIRWESGSTWSYDVDWLDENVTIIEKGNTL